MKNEHQIIKEVYEAKTDSKKADDLILKYIPFIRSEASKSMNRPCSEQDDEYSIAMIAFHEAILGYEQTKGAFLSYASMLIRSRIIDYYRKESRHKGNISLYAENGESGRPLLDELAHKDDQFDESANMEAAKAEIAELSRVMEGLGVSFFDIADNCPKQERTLKACYDAVRYATQNRQLLDELIMTKKLPLNRLALGSGVHKKTLERHRKYILAMLLIQTNGYEMIRSHIRQVLRGKGGSI